MSKEAILDYFKDINAMYNDCTRYDTLKHMLDELFEPCNDCISRQAAIDTIENWLSCDDYNDAERHIMRAMQSVLYDLPPVTPAEKVGQWVKTLKAVMGEGYMWYCDKCEHQVYQDSSRPYPSEKYCPNCGAKM